MQNTDLAPTPRPSFPFESTRTRRTIIASYWVVVFLALPLWWWTTSIQRVALPRAEVNAQATAANQLKFPVEILLDVGGLVDDPDRLALALGNVVQKRASEDQDKWKGLDIRIAEDKAKLQSEYYYTIELSKDVEKPTIKGRTLTYGINGQQNDVIAQELGNVVSALLAPPAKDNRVTQYSSRYRLSFTLLNEDVRIGGIRGWGIEESIQLKLQPVLDQLKPLYNFTIESQVQYYGPLTFEPPKRSGGIKDTGEEVEYWVLGTDELQMFINSEEWTLSSSISNDPVLHLLLYAPKDTMQPLRVLNPDGSFSRSNAFIVPQWGGVIVFNPPSGSTGAGQAGRIFDIFRSQLLTLLGVPDLPPNVTADPPHLLTEWQLDALLRRRTKENVQGSVEALSSILKLTDRIENMPIGPDVRGNFTDALQALEQVYNAAPLSPSLALLHSSDALERSSSAFFHPTMVGQLYFPPEHKYAVYVPLFGPAAVPLIGALVREYKEWKRKREEERQKREEKGDKQE